MTTEEKKDLKGENNNRSKLTNAQVLEIRELYSNGAKQVELSQKFGVIQAHISLIVNRKIWTHI